MEDINSWHEPAMLEQVLFFLDCKSDGFYVDGTLGGGGHAEAILKKNSPKGKLLGIDRDSTSLEFAKKRLQFFDNRVHIFHGCFSNLPDFLEKAGRKSVDGILLDLGVSSHQLDNALRGFSIKNDGDLDMRMDQSMAASAYDIINQTDEAGLEYIISTFGEERYARSISRNIVNCRKKAPIRSTKELADIVINAIPARLRYKQKIHPATRTFQAIRIAVNDELEILDSSLTVAINGLKGGGRIAVISFHSLEDRIVKWNFFQEAKEERLRIITRKPIIPQEAEINSNPASRSAKLRVAEKVSVQLSAG